MNFDRKARGRIVYGRERSNVRARVHMFGCAYALVAKRGDPEVVRENRRGNVQCRGSLRAHFDTRVNKS